MVYISTWQEYQEAAETLYTKSPNNTRYCIKWRSREGKLVLKITDDTTCLKFKTGSSIFLNRFEALNLSLMEKMQNCKTPSAEQTSITTQSTTRSIPEFVQSTAAAPAATSIILSGPGASAGTGSGIKKKKGKKKGK